MSRPTRITCRSLALLGLFVFSSGCGQSSFVGRRYDDFTAYYNTFYNAEKAYREGIKVMEQADEPIDRRIYLSVFPTPGTATGTQFVDAINKSADVLRKHPDSKWVDDALLLIGQSYYYQRNFVGAEQKFREVMNLGTVLEDEARLWLARTLIAAGAYDEARDHLTVSLAREDLSPRWAPMLHLALGELYVKNGSYEDAALELEAGIEEVRDNAVEARSWFLLGQVFETLGRYEQAVNAYERVAGAHPRYELFYASQYSAVRVKGLHLDADEALRELRRMERDDKNYSYRFELAYLRGRIYQAQGYFADARDLYEEILYDSDEQIGDVRGRIHYALGELYRDDYRDFVLASAHFDTARTALSTAAVPVAGARTTVQHAPEAITDAQQQAQMFRSFAEVRQEIARMDSLLYLGQLSDEEFDERILEIRRDMARELAEQRKRAQELQAERGFQAAAMDPNMRQDQQPQASGSSEAGFLFHRDPVRVQEARMNFLAIWGERPRVPNWRRLQAVTGSTVAADGSEENLPSPIRDTDPGVGEEPLPPLDYSDVPRDSLTQAALRAERALARYELANVLFLAMNRADSAATWYRLVIDEDAGERVAQRAFYALAEVHRSLGDSASARQLYRQVLDDYPDSDFAGRVREQLGIQEEVSSDSLDMAMDAYERASERWGRRQFRDAFDRMIRVAADFKKTEFGAKALLAAGQIYLEWADRDSLDVFGPIPISPDDSLLAASGMLEALVERRVVTPIQPAASPPAEPAVTPTPDAPVSQEEGVPAQETPELREEAVPVADSTAVPTEGDQVPDSPDARVVGRTITPPKKGDALSRNLTPEPQTQAGTPENLNAGTSEDLGVPPGTSENPGTTEDLNPADTTTQDPGVTPAPTPESFTVPVVVDSIAAENQGSQPVADELADAVVETPADTTEADSLAAQVPESTEADSPAAQAPDTTGAPAEAAPLEEEVIEEVNLISLYGGVKVLYPNTPYATQAGKMQLALQERKRELQAIADSLAKAELLALAPSDSASTALTDSLAAVTPDSLLTVPSDSLLSSPSDSLLSSPSDRALTAAADSLALLPESASDSPASTADAAPDASLRRGLPPPAPPAVAAIPTGDAAIRGEGGIKRELGGFTLIIGMNVNREPMDQLVEKYVKRGFRADVLVEKSPDGETYRAALGHFATQREAGMALNQYIAQIEESAQLAPLTPVEPQAPKPEQ